jgi:hypothetical protein
MVKKKGECMDTGRNVQHSAVHQNQSWHRESGACRLHIGNIFPQQREIKERRGVKTAI